MDKFLLIFFLEILVKTEPPFKTPGLGKGVRLKITNNLNKELVQCIAVDLNVFVMSFFINGIINCF